MATNDIVKSGAKPSDSELLVEALVLISKQGAIIDLLKEALREIENEWDKETIDNMIGAYMARVWSIESEK